MIKFHVFLAFSIFFLALGCTKNNSSSGSNDKKITYFAFENLSPVIEGEINDADKLISFTIPSEYDLTTLVPSIEISDKATIDPPAGVQNDFSSGANYKVTAENGTVELYFVQVETQSNLNELIRLDIPALYQVGSILDDKVTFTFPYGTDITSLLVDAEFSAEALIDVDFSSEVNLQELREINITSEFGETRTYDIEIIFLEQETGVRGVWLTNVASDALFSRDNIVEAMDRIERLNFNTVFMVTWNKTTTPYTSAVLENTISDPTYESNMFPGRDVLQEVIEEAHARDLKVIAWFEYGFASQFGDSNGGRNVILQEHPEWESRNQEGGIANQNNFYWMNAFHPDVQQFMLDLVLEVVEKYDVDGVQGDDRLPAVTTTSGYDNYTVNLYKEQHGGSEPPSNVMNQGWVQWRSDILTDYAERVFNEVKASDPNCIVSFSPSAYSFSLFNYCQDWPEWVEREVVDILSPQLYRRESQGIAAYKDLVNYSFNLANNKSDEFFPGILLQVGNYVPSEAYLVDLVRHNRSIGVTGEVYFFYEGLKIRDRAFEILYPEKAIYPSF